MDKFSLMSQSFGPSLVVNCIGHSSSLGLVQFAGGLQNVAGQCKPSLTKRWGKCLDVDLDKI